MTAMFHDMLHNCVKDYIDDIMLKCKEVSQHIGDQRRIFLRHTCYNLRINPLKNHLVFVWKIVGIHNPSQRIDLH